MDIRPLGSAKRIIACTLKKCSTIRPKTSFTYKGKTGHRDIKNTLICIDLADLKDDEEYIAKVTKTVEEACQMIEAVFEYVTEIDGVKLFRKRK